RTWRAAGRIPRLRRRPLEKGGVIDRYLIIRHVGDTDDGAVYEAFDTTREDRVALKLLDMLDSDPAAAALLAVTPRVAEVEHPYLLGVVATGTHGGHPYIVYEFVKGVPLSQASAEDARATIALFAQAGRGLAAAHEAGIVHGCFTPASCVVGRDGRVTVL